MGHRGFGALVIGCLLASTGCSVDDATACTPGNQKACACPESRTGSQSCNADGMGWGACDCSGGTGGTGGTGGGVTGGTGGEDAGTGGTGGTNTGGTGGTNTGGTGGTNTGGTGGTNTGGTGGTSTGGTGGTSTGGTGGEDAGTGGTGGSAGVDAGDSGPEAGGCGGSTPDDCGACVNVLSDPAHCGGCNQPCSDNHVTPSCNAGVCMGACDPNFADCDNDKRVNGCETDTTLYGCAGPSCAAGVTCGSKSCCETRFVPGGTFQMGRGTTGEDAYCPWDTSIVCIDNEKPEHDVTVSPFYLDTFEVTVGRFRPFADQYDGTPPASGAGANPHVPGSGWQPSWNAQLPVNRDDLLASITCNGNDQTWTSLPTTHEPYAMNCLSWFVSFAFCIWDGKRLPTEAEWEFAAAGGSQDHPYPWGAGVDATRASYKDSANSPFVNVGSYPDGMGLFGQLDLAGSMWEWTLDWYAANWYAGGGATCQDCANLTTAASRVHRGGAWWKEAGYMRAAHRSLGSAPTWRSSTVGVRCASTHP